MSASDPPVALDHATIEWERVASARYHVVQTLRYEYEAPIRDLQHRLIVAPRRRHLDQQRLDHRLWSSAHVSPTLAADRFGNAVASLHVAQVDREITFGLESTIVRDRRLGRFTVRDASTARWLRGGRLTRLDESLRLAALDLRAQHRDADALAHAIMHFVHRHMTYTKGVTDVFTTASTAFAMRHGVCQDYAHVAIALARACGIPARYASGHLIGEGATHAWVEFLIDACGTTQVLSLDPTHGVETDFRYIVVAIGRDYDDVPPTSGSFTGRSCGTLYGQQHVQLVHVTYNA
jgi:transglutaminase-like putative cysteine protease